jgi:hypothetical protein
MNRDDTASAARHQAEVREELQVGELLHRVEFLQSLGDQVGAGRAPPPDHRPAPAAVRVVFTSNQ